MKPRRREPDPATVGNLPSYDDFGFDWRDFVTDADLDRLAERLRRAAWLTCLGTSVDSETIPSDDVDAIDQWLQSTDASQGGHRRVWCWHLVLNPFPYPRGAPVPDPNGGPFGPAW